MNKRFYSVFVIAQTLLLSTMSKNVTKYDYMGLVVLTLWLVLMLLLPILRYMTRRSYQDARF